MIRLSIAISLLASAANAQELTPEELLRMAAEERANPTPLSCCDWGGSCIVPGRTHEASSAAPDVEAGESYFRIAPAAPLVAETLPLDAPT